MSVFDGLQLPKIIYETTSAYNGKIEVWEVGTVRKLRVGDINQSLSAHSQGAQNLVWGRVIKVIQENEPLAAKIMVLGLGGGTMQHLMSKALPTAQIVSVEIDSVMIDIAKNYFDLDKIPNHRIINDDACRVIVDPKLYNLDEKSFNVVVVDIYCGDKYPDLGKSGNFIGALKRIVIPGGLIIFNRIYTEHHQDDVNNFIETVSTMLYDVKSLVVAGHTNSDNVLIYGRS